MNNNDSNINAFGEKIRAVFYFVDDLEYEGVDGYKDMCQKGKIELRTIVFAKKQRAIYKGGDMYCPMEDETFKRILLRMLDEEDVIDALIQFIKKHRNNLPIASREELGAIIVGVTLDIAENGTLNINEESIKNIIKNYINGAGSNDMPKASKDQYGVVKIGDGINVDNGVISVKFSNLPSTTQDELLNLIYQFFQNKSNLRASTTQYGVVKVQPNGGILVNDGVISLDPNAIVAPGNIPQPTNYSINRFYSETVGNRNNIVLEQNNNNASPFTCDITSLVQNIINNTGGGNSGSNTDIKIRINPNNFHWEISYDGGVTWQDLGVVAKGQDGKDGQDGRDGQDGKDGKDGQDGTSGTTTTELINIFQTSDDIIDELLKRIEELEKAQQTGSTIMINDAVTNIIKAINENNWNEIFHSSGWSNAMLAYLQEVGIITQWVNDNGTVTTTLNTTQITQNQSFIDAVASRIDTTTSTEGLLERITALESELQIGTEERTAYAKLSAALADWDTSKGTIRSALSTTNNNVSDIDGKLTAVAGQSASVISDYSFTAAQMGLYADPTGAQADLVSSFGEYLYTTDENGDEQPIYEVDSDGDVLYQVDEQGHMLPYTGFLLKHVNANGEVTDNSSNWVLCKDKDGNVIKDKNGNNIYRQVAIKVWYTADASGNYQGTSYYITSDNINFNSDGSIQWEYYGTQNGKTIYKISQNGGSPIAYHKVRKMKLTSASGVVTKANAEQALGELFAKYSTSDDTVTTQAMTTAIANARNASITSAAKATFYESRKSDDPNSDDIEFLWRKSGEPDRYSVNSPGEGWTKVPRTESVAGLSSYVDEKIASSTLSASLAGIRSEISTKVTLDDVNGAISSATINANQINIDADHELNLSAPGVKIDATRVENLASTIDARAANVIVKSLSAKDGTSEVTVNSDGITIKPTSSTTSISLNKNGSGNVASGNISWDVNGKVTIKNFNLPEYNNVLFIHSDTDYATNITALANGSSTTPILHTTFNYVTFINGIAYQYFSPLASDTSSYNGTSAFAQQLKQNNPTMFTPGSKVLLVDFHTNTYKGNTPTRYIQMAGNDASWDNYKTLCTALENASGAYSQVGNNSYITW